MAGQTEIYNLALLQLGEEAVLSPDEGSKAADRLNEVWPLLFEEVLASHDWTFARRRAVLAAAAAGPAFGYSYAYQLPADFLRLPEVQADDYNAWSEYPWRLEGQQLLTDAAAVELVYTARVDLALCSVRFRAALASRLAAALAFALTKKSGIAKNMWDLYMMQLTEAQSQDARQAGRVRKSSKWQLARY